MTRKGDARTRANDDLEARASRETQVDASRGEGDDLMSLDELRDQVRSEFVQESLPQLKPPPGWHYCWLSVTSQHDPIHKRLRVGYRPVNFEELLAQNQGKGFENYKQIGGEFAGAVACNEMVLFKIINERYQIIMSEFHHRMPLEEERSIKAKVETANKADSSGKKLLTYDTEDEGMKELGAEPAVDPVFV